MAPDPMDPREEHHSIPSPHSGLSLFLRRLAPEAGHRRPVLYVHGATFPSALSVAYRFTSASRSSAPCSNGSCRSESWRDVLVGAGFDVWALDFLGFGGSDRYPAMSAPAEAAGPLLLAADAALQLEAAVRFVAARTGFERVSLLAHSWGTAVAGLLAGRHPELVDRLVLFGPIGRRDPPHDRPRPDAPAWRIVTAEAQWDRFVEDVPPGEPPVLPRAVFDAWAEHYLDTDPESRHRGPAGVKVPTGPFVEILRSWHGEPLYDAGLVRAPVCLIRGAWDGLADDADARRLFDGFRNAPDRRDVKIARGTHLLHLEVNRTALWHASTAFLGEPSPP